MCVFLKTFDYSEKFNCHAVFPCYKCDFWSRYTTNERVFKYNHQCKSKGYKARFRRCKQCKAGSHSIAWHYFHEQKCNFNIPSVAKANNLLEKLIQCDQCDFKTNRHVYLKHHIKRKHTPNYLKRWSHCHECELKTYDVKNLKNYKYNKHTPTELQKWFKRDQCEHKTHKKVYLLEHKRRKHGLIGRYKLS